MAAQTHDAFTTPTKGQEDPREGTGSCIPYSTQLLNFSHISQMHPTHSSKQTKKLKRCDTIHLIHSANKRRTASLPVRRNNRLTVKILPSNKKNTTKRKGQGIAQSPGPTDSRAADPRAEFAVQDRGSAYPLTVPRDLPRA